MRGAILSASAVGLVAGSAAWPADPSRAPTAESVRAIDAALVACGTRHSLSSWEGGTRGIGCARDVVVAEFNGSAKADAGARVIVDAFEAASPRTRDVPAKLQNVYLVVPGSDAILRTTAFFVSGHYDSICSDVMDSSCDAPGADDDASGTTVAIAAARMNAGRPHRATIVYAALAAEEQGLLGGKRLLAWAKEQGYAIGGLLNNDIVGAMNGSKDARPRVFSDDDASSPSRFLGLWLDEHARGPGVRLVFRKDRFGRGGDHLPFLEAGAPAVRFTEPREDYRHQHQTPRIEGGVEYGDLPKFMDFDFLARVAALNADAVLALANAPAPPTSATCEGAVKPDTTVSFEATDDPNRVGFEILSRDTVEPRFKVQKTVASAGTITLEDVRIDDACFAVRSIDAAGRRSIAVEAKPQVRRAAAPPPTSK